jgi:hypothetical protein
MQEEGGRFADVNEHEPTPAELLRAEPEVIDETGVRICPRCKERGDNARHVAAGHGTVEEIRDAMAILEAERRAGIRLGAKIKIDGGWHCPRCTGMPHPETGGEGPKALTVPIISELPNRAARRRAKLHVRR